MDEQLKRDYETISQAWQILKKYGDIKEHESWWHALIRDIGEFESRGCLAEEIGSAILNTLDLRNKSQKRYGDCGHDGEIRLQEIRATNRRREKELEELRELREWREANT